MEFIGKCGGEGNLSGCGHTIHKKDLFIFNEELLESTIRKGGQIRGGQVGYCPKCELLLVRDEIKDKGILVLMDL